jgi:hypothetical protein
MTDFVTSILQLEKRCIFCGERPSEKNREHVIPRWLIALTGDPKREWHLGVKFGDPSKPARAFTADQFQFPACESCNSRYSGLEARTKSHMTKLLNEENLTGVEWDDLLDWFDKVRIGLFIGNMMLNKDLPIPDPKFFIDQRSGAKDRCLLIYPNRSDYFGLRMIGAGDPVFFYNPTSFMLAVNGLLFLNASSDFLLAPRMGFPFPRETRMQGPYIAADDFTALYRPKLPFIRFSFYQPSLGIYQTILNTEILNEDAYSALAHTDYVGSKLVPGSPIKTQPCAVTNGTPTFLGTADRAGALRLPKKSIKTFDEYCLRFFEYRYMELERAIEIAEPVSRPLIRTIMKFNGYAIDQTNSGIYSL